jgi:formylmethanofuran dehydrogenase subunit E
MPLDVQYVAEDTTGNGALEFAHRGKAALVGANTKYDAGVVTGGNGAFRLLSGEGKRLLAPYRPALATATTWSTCKE